jgi:hypothetical protein
MTYGPGRYRQPDPADRHGRPGADGAHAAAGATAAVVRAAGRVERESPVDNGTWQPRAQDMFAVDTGFIDRWSPLL